MEKLLQTSVHKKKSKKIRIEIKTLQGKLGPPTNDGAGPKKGRA